MNNNTPTLTRQFIDACGGTAELASIVDQWANVPDGTSSIDAEGSVHVGTHWLDQDGLSDFLLWLQSQQPRNP